MHVKYMRQASVHTPTNNTFTTGMHQTQTKHNTIRQKFITSLGGHYFLDTNPYSHFIKLQSKIITNLCSAPRDVRTPLTKYKNIFRKRIHEHSAFRNSKCDSALNRKIDKTVVTPLNRN